MIIQEQGARGIPPDLAKIRLGFIASLGVLAYAIGKFVSGGLSDFLGGRRTFLGGMAGRSPPDGSRFLLTGLSWGFSV